MILTLIFFLVFSVVFYYLLTKVIVPVFLDLTKPKETKSNRHDYLSNLYFDVDESEINSINESELELFHRKQAVEGNLNQRIESANYLKELLNRKQEQQKE
jgi:hypothetical protein